MRREHTRRGDAQTGSPAEQSEEQQQPQQQPQEPEERRSKRGRQRARQRSRTKQPSELSDSDQHGEEKAAASDGCKQAQSRGQQHTDNSEQTTCATITPLKQFQLVEIAAQLHSLAACRSSTTVHRALLISALPLLSACLSSAPAVLFNTDRWQILLPVNFCFVMIRCLSSRSNVGL